uniref:Uncharacterized protein n=1 Tax=Romanomermis culicivorax TaxID=13658 RepID=A0A915IWW4_ROMCU
MPPNFRTLFSRFNLSNASRGVAIHSQFSFKIHCRSRSICRRLPC